MALNNEVRMRLSQMLRQWDHEHRRHSRMDFDDWDFDKGAFGNRAFGNGAFDNGTFDKETGPTTMFLTEQNHRDLKNYLAEKGGDNTTFSEMVLHRISQTGKKDSDVYNAAGISRSIFSNLRNNRNYQPSRETALCLTIALEMTLEESEKLMKKAGFALSDDRRFDQIIRFCMMNKIYNIMDVNELLYESGEQTILLKGDKKDLK